MQVRGILSDEEDMKIWLCVCVCGWKEREVKNFKNISVCTANGVFSM